MPYALQFLRALGLTLTVELAVAWVVLLAPGDLLGHRVVRTRASATVVAASFLTLPYVWFVLPELLPERTTFLLVAESWAILAEATIYRWVLSVTPTRALLFSLLLNAASFAVGLALLP